jgi:MFS family permease
VVSYSLNDDGLKNWISRLGLESAEPYKIGLFGTFSYFAEVATNLILPPLSDKYGRRYFTFFGSMLQLLVYLTFSVSKSYGVYLATILFFGISVTIRYSIAYSHMLELYPKKQAAVMSSVLFFIDGFIAMLAPCLLLITKDVQYLVYLGALFQGATLIMFWKLRP